MGLSSDDYLRELQALLPRGAAWTREPDSTLANTLQGLAGEMARVDARALVAIDETDPRTANELFFDQEAQYGLPDPCVALVSTTTQSLGQRRTALIAKIANLGGQARSFFVALAASMGFVVTITEFAPESVDSDVDSFLYDDDWVFSWQVNAPLVGGVDELSVDSPVDEALASWGNQLLECVFGRLKAAHTAVLFSYT